MTKYFVTWEIARRLEEKGFHYDKSKELDRVLISNVFFIPPIYRVLEWLREEKKMHITVLVITDCSNDADNNTCEEWSFWSFSVINLNDGSTLYDDFEKIDCIEYQSYEEAALAGIEYVLNLI